MRFFESFTCDFAIQVLTVIQVDMNSDQMYTILAQLLNCAFCAPTLNDVFVILCFYHWCNNDTITFCNKVPYLCHFNKCFME